MLAQRNPRSNTPGLTDPTAQDSRKMRRLGVCLAVGLYAALALVGLPVLAQQDALGIFFLFDRSGSMSQAMIDGELRHGAETAALLEPTNEVAGGGFFAAPFQELAPLGSPIVASQAFTAAQGTAPSGGTDLVEGLNQAESQLGTWPGQKVIVIYGDGCTNDSGATQSKIQSLQGSGHLVVYVQIESGCNHVADIVDLYYPFPLWPTPEELMQDIDPEPVSLEGTVYPAYRGELLNVKWNLPITVTWTDGSQTSLTSFQKEYEVSWGDFQPSPGDGSTLLYFKSPNDTGSPLVYTVPFTWQGLSGEHTIVVDGDGLYDHLEIELPTLVEVGQVFTYTVSIVDEWGNETAVLPPAQWDTLYRLGGSSTLVQPISWQWQAGLGATQEFTASAGLMGSESLQFGIGPLDGWSNQFQVVAQPPGPYRSYLPLVMRANTP